MRACSSMNPWVAAALLVISALANAQGQPRPEPPQITLALEDQFERKHDVGQYRGNVLVLVYGDREAATANRALGEKLHVHYHPAAKGKPPGEAARAPVTPGLDSKEGERSPDVRVVPVACIGKVPGPVKHFIRGAFRKDAPETAVLLDFENKMKDQFGLRAGEPNLVVIDGAGRLRMKMAGELDQDAYGRLLQAIDYLRKEGVMR